MDGLLERYSSLPKKEKDIISRSVIEQTRGLRFIPSPGPQTHAVNSKADILLYGGEAGGGKSCLMAGLALTEHENSLLMRRQYTQLSGLVEETIKLYGTRKGYNGSAPPSMRTTDKRFIQFGAVDKSGDEQNWKGRPRDFLGLDEVVDFEESQVRFLMGWVRSAKEGQRCRVIMATNPPVDGKGAWLVKMFAPWLDPDHPNPAEQGELRWFVVENGNDIEVDGPDAAYIDATGKELIPQSRTFIRARLSDNPYLGKDYEATLDALPEPYRSAYRDGNFFIKTQDAIRQIIPSSWVRAAQERWVPIAPAGIAMSAIGVDISAGGNAKTVLAPRHGPWFAKFHKEPGSREPNGPAIAGSVMAFRKDNAKIVLDMGGGYGGETYRILKDNGVEVTAYKGSHGGTKRTKDNQFKFVNKRSQSYYLFREALDPNQPGGSQVMLPPSKTLFEDLTTPTFTITTKGIQMQPKEEIEAKLGRSTDEGDAVIMSWSEGVQSVYNDMQGLGASNFNPNTGRQFPKVILGHEKQRRK